MQKSRDFTNRRMRRIFVLVILIILGLVIRLGYLQITRGEELRKGALEQWTRGVTLKSKRGIIYDRNGKKLAVSQSASTVWASPKDIKESQAKGVAKELARVLKLDEEKVYGQIREEVSNKKIKQWITKEEADNLRKLNLSGISVVDDNKRYYPYGQFAPYVLGFTDIDNNGLDGIENTYDKYLAGTPGKWIKTTDGPGGQLPFDGERIYESSDGSGVVLTIDETIQNFAEKAAEKSLAKTKAKNISIIIMEPDSGDILAMVNKPDYDPNSPRQAPNEATQEEWDKLESDELQNKWYNMWRNFSISDIYEPGSTFKAITTAIAIEENIAQPDTNYFCNGSINVQGTKLRCSSWYDPHGAQTFTQGLNSSCNIVFVDTARKIGKEQFYRYIKAFGFGENTGIDLNGEQAGIIPINTDVIRDVNLATMSYGHGIAVTPLQLVNAFSAIANGGNLMKPRLVKQVIDLEGNLIEEYKPEIRRKVISKSTSEKTLKMLESVVLNGTGSSAYIPGFRVGGKTGTAEKVIDGRYAKGKYIGSFGAIAPVDDPKIAILVVVDEPEGQYYGGSVAAPVANEIIEDTLNYLEVPPIFTEKEESEVQEMTIVPDVRNMKIGDAGRILTDAGLRYSTEYSELTSESVILDQYPLANTEIRKKSIIDLYFNEKNKGTIVMPHLIGKTKEEVIEVLEKLNLNYELKGKDEGVVNLQKPLFSEEIHKDTKIEVEFK